MKTAVISIESLEQYLRLEREYQRLAVGLLHYKALLEQTTKLLVDINKSAQYLHDHKDTPWWNNMSVEAKNEITKHGKWSMRR